MNLPEDTPVGLPARGLLPCSTRARGAGVYALPASAEEEDDMSAERQRGLKPAAPASFALA